MSIERSVEPAPESVIVDQVRLMAYRFARRLTRNDVAEDIAQDVALDYLLKVRDQHWKLETTLEALVASMTWRKHACRTRRENHRRAAEEQFMAELTARAPDWMQPARDCEAREDERIREQALKELPAMARIAFRMVHEQGTTHSAAAKTMGVSRELVTKHVRRAEQQLVDRLLNAGTRSHTPPSMQQPSLVQRHTALGRRTTTPHAEEDDDEATMNIPRRVRNRNDAAQHKS